MQTAITDTTTTGTAVHAGVVGVFAYGGLVLSPGMTPAANRPRV